jgi:hypothetical protein
MVNNIVAGVIGCNMTEEFFQSSVRNSSERFYWKKIFCADNNTLLSKRFPEAEIVTNTEMIVNDEEISLVFVSSKQLQIVPKVLDAGKSVRLV